jgi:hypothetical protein
VKENYDAAPASAFAGCPLLRAAVSASLAGVDDRNFLAGVLCYEGRWG